MSPRLVPAATKVSQVVRGTGGKVQLAQPSPRIFSSDTLRQPDVKMPCPLCIEELDDTDRDFFPCPCGYQLCLFCYEQVKEKCNSQCPGCRREYGEPVEAPSKQGSDDRPLAGRTSQRAAGSPPGQQNVGQSNRAAAAAAAAAAALALPSSKQQRAQDPSGGGGARGMRGDDAAPAALPSGATWAAAALGAAARHPPPSTPADRPSTTQTAASVQVPPVDTSSWPSLMDSTASSMRRPARQEPPHMTLFTQSLSDAADSDASRCRSSSPSSADLTPMDSHSSSSQDLGHDQSRSAHLQEAHSTPGGRAGQAPAAGGARAAAAPRSSLAASKAPPPGFGAAPAPAAAIAACPTQQDPSVSGPPLGRFQPIQPPTHYTSSSQQQQLHLQVNHSYYSLWSGLPGIELNLGQAFGPIHVVGVGAYQYPCNPPLGPFQSCYAAKPPPPGFGPSPYAPAQDLGAQNGLRMYQAMNSAAAGNGQFGAVRPSMAV